MAKLVPPVPAAPPDDANEYGKPPKFVDGDMEATTGPRETAKASGPPSRVVTPRQPAQE